MIDEFIKTLFQQHDYSWPNICLYLLSGILAGLVRLTIRNHAKAEIRSWLNDGTLAGGLIISVAGAFLFDNSFLWSFLGGYFIVYILDFIERKLEKDKEDLDDK